MWFLFYFLLLLGLVDLVWRERVEEILAPWEGKTSAGERREKNWRRLKYLEMGIIKKI